MRERPIIFSGPMALCIRADRKTQTRRVVTGDKLGGPLDLLAEGFTPKYVAHEENGLCPYGVPGDRLWVRENVQAVVDERDFSRLRYPADGQLADIENTAEGADRWLDLYHYDAKRRPKGSVVPSIHMPRWACRLVLELTEVRVERLQDISEADARAEGCPVTWDGKPYDPPPPEVDSWQGYGRYSFCLLWNSINGKRAGCTWDDNPWVWALTFKRVTA